MTTAIIDYGMGNLGSLSRALQKFTTDFIVSDDPEKILNSSRIILPGVGGFPVGMQNLKDRRLDSTIKKFALEMNKPVLGICLGMQLLATSSAEEGQTNGLNLIEGTVERLSSFGCSFRLPHIGWNSLEDISTNSKILDGIPDQTDVYFVHSFAYQLSNQSHRSSTTNYDIDFPSTISKENIFGTQYHPEKSSKAGMKILNNFLTINA